MFRISQISSKRVQNVNKKQKYKKPELCFHNNCELYFSLIIRVLKFKFSLFIKMPYTCIDITIIENGQMNLDQNHCHTLLMLIMFFVPSLDEIFITTTK